MIQVRIKFERVSDPPTVDVFDTLGMKNKSSPLLAIFSNGLDST